MNIAPIRNEKDYQKALERLEEIFDSKKGTEQGDELEILSILIDRFENISDLRIKYIRENINKFTTE